MAGAATGAGMTDGIAATALAPSTTWATAASLRVIEGLALSTADACSAASTAPLRIATYNVSLYDEDTGGLVRRLELGNPQARQIAAVLQRVDKYDKIGPAGVRELLVNELGLTEAQAETIIKLAGICTDDLGFVDEVRALGVKSELLDEGLDELATLVGWTSKLAPGGLVADLKIARGLDYYTGTVYETLLQGSEKLGSIASGGRYDSLASDGRTTYPGVGYSFGISRMIVPMINSGKPTVSRSVPSAVLVAVDSEEHREAAMGVASELRLRGIPVEVAPKPDKFGKQIRYASRRGIPYVWFGAGYDDSVKDIRSGEQSPADPSNWELAAEDRQVQVGVN